MCIDMGWWNTGGDSTPVDGVSGDWPWDLASDWIRAYVDRFDRAPKRSEVMGAFDAMFNSARPFAKKKAHTGWCPEDHPVERVDEF
jgi:hypothetical protein